jgi:hypothetical protein
MAGKQIGGLSWKIWVGVAIAGLALGIYLRKRGGTSTDVGAATSYPLSIQQPSTGTLDGAVAGGGINSAAPAIDPSTLNDLLAGNASLSAAEQTLIEQTQGLTDAIGTLVYNVGSSGGSGSSADGNSPNPTVPPYSTATKPVQKTPAVSKPAAKAVPAPAKQPPARYYTYKNQVKLGKGQSLHFTSGKGYYAA